VEMSIVIPTAGRNLGTMELVPPQMIRRCGWLSMTLSYQ
jgi:hypothetical protein